MRKIGEVLCRREFKAAMFTVGWFLGTTLALFLFVNVLATLFVGVIPLFDN